MVCRMLRCPARIRTSISRSRVCCLAVRRRGNSRKQTQFTQFCRKCQRFLTEADLVFVYSCTHFCQHFLRPSVTSWLLVFGLDSAFKVSGIPASCKSYRSGRIGERWMTRVTTSSDSGWFPQDFANPHSFCVGLTLVVLKGKFVLDLRVL